MGCGVTGNYYMRNLKPVRLNELKLEATFLLKDLKSNSGRTPAVLSKFKLLPCFAGKTDDDLLSHQVVKLKHAYQFLALSRGFESWGALKQYIVDKDCMYRPYLVPYVHSWFNDYPSATKYQQKNGGYLLAFWDDIIICGEEYIKGLNLNKYKEEWQAIAFDWVKPKDPEAWHYLREKAKSNYLKL